MVFQNYALYPHMNAFDNMAFALKMRGVAKPDVARRVDEAARILGLTDSSEEEAANTVRGAAPARRDGAGDRPGAQGISDGRAALEPGREAPCRDAHRDLTYPARPRRDDHLRHARSDGSDDHGRPGRSSARRRATAGRLTAEPLSRPANLFVAEFIGSPAMNLVQGTLVPVNGGLGVRFGDHMLRVAERSVSGAAGTRLVRGTGDRGRHPAGGHRGRGPRSRAKRRPDAVRDHGSSGGHGGGGRSALLRARGGGAGDGSHGSARARGVRGDQGTGAPSRCSLHRPRRPAHRSAGRQVSRLFVDVEHLHFFDPDSGLGVYDGVVP